MSEKIRPVDGNVLVEPTMPSKKRAQEVMDRSGLYMAKPDNKTTSFEGIPKTGVVYSLPDSYDGPLSEGMTVVFDDQKPKAFKWEDKTIFRVSLDRILAEVL